MVVNKKQPFGKNISKTNQSTSSFINRFNLNYYQKKDKQFLLDARELLTVDPVSKFCTEIIFLYFFSCMKEYNQTSKKITKDINNSISNCKGSWIDSVKLMASCYWYGYSFTQVAVDDAPFNRKTLKELYTFDPLKYDFVLKNGEIDKIFYYDFGETIEINPKSGIHLIVCTDTSFDYVLGCGRVESALPYWELHKMIMPVIAIAGQRQATPILVKKTETDADVIVIDSATGMPVIDPITGDAMVVKKGWDSVKQLEELGIAGITVIDPDDDLYSIDLNVNGDFLINILKLADQYRMTSLLVPVTIFSITNSGVGDSGLSKIHLEVFQKSIVNMVRFVTENLVEKLIRPLVIYNFGEQDDYGYFKIEENNPDSLEIAKVAISVIDKGVVELADIEMINRIRTLLGLSEKQE